ncbi:hypothetical protein BJI48_03960 [Helicobacter sp. 11S02596-1]|nr:hypothetical protein BJI48_03960 [Helicobacter sp. 11S02596-1]
MARYPQKADTSNSRKLQYSDIYIIAHHDCKSEIEAISKEIHFIDENKDFPDLNYDVIYNLMQKFHLNPKSTGWFFQQFLKLSFCEICPKGIYMTFDVDSLLIRDLVIDRVFFNVLRGKVSRHNAYIATNQAILGMSNFYRMEFVSEFMIFQTEIVKELIALMAQNHQSYFENILAVMGRDPKTFSFSEFETYANYCLINKKGGYFLKSMDINKYGKRFFDSIPALDSNEISDFAKYCYILEFNHWCKISKYSKIMQNKFLRKVFGVKNLVRVYYKTGMCDRDRQRELKQARLKPSGERS